MGRKPKCTVEEKISAVEDYLNGIRSVSQIMVDLSIKSTRTIRVWILAYQNGGIEAIFPVTANHSYSKEFKNEMVQRYIDGEGSVTDLCADMGFLLLEPGGIDHSESSRNNQSELIRNSQCTCLAN